MPITKVFAKAWHSNSSQIRVRWAQKNKIMAPKVTFVKQEINWFALLPKLLVIGILCACFYPVDKKNFFFFGVFIYFILTLIARWLFFPNDLYKGTELIREAKFKDAIPYVQKTIDYYKQKPWVDKYRFWLLISSSKRSILESSTCNLAYCFLQIGEVNHAKQIYQNLLYDYPENINAIGMLNTIKLISNASENKATN